MASDQHLTKVEMNNQVEAKLALMSAEERDMYWRCKECLFIGGGLFGLNCRNCGRQRSNPYTKKDWMCPRCNVSIFASKDRCKKCDSRKGDWKCACQFVNFASRTACKSCEAMKPSALPADGIKIL
jgi:hypothetical protein